MRKNVSQGRISAERQPPDFVVDLADGAELARQVNVGLDVDRTQTLGELAGFLRAVVALHMLTRPRNGEHVEQLEIIEAQHVHQPRGASLILGAVEPAVELPLRLADGRLASRTTLPVLAIVTAFNPEKGL